MFLFSPVFWIWLLLVPGIKQSHWSSGSKPFFFFFCLSGAQRDSIRTSLTLSRGQSSVRAGGFTSSLSHAKKRKKKNSPSHPTRHTGAFPYIISCAVCKNNPLFFLCLLKGTSLSESVTDPHDGTIMIFWRGGRCLIRALPLFSSPHCPNCMF